MLSIYVAHLRRQPDIDRPCSDLQPDGKSRGAGLHRARDRRGRAAERGWTGACTRWFGIGQSIYNIPFYLAGRTVGHLIGPGVGKPDTFTKAAVGMGTTLPAAGCAALVFLFAWRLTSAPGPSLAAAFALAFGTIMWPYSKFGFNMPLAACLVLSGTYLVWRGVRGDSVARLSAGGALLGCAFLTRHESPFLFLPLYVWILAESWPDLRRMMKHLAAASWTFALAVPALDGVQRGEIWSRARHRSANRRAALHRHAANPR